MIEKLYLAFWHFRWILLVGGWIGTGFLQQLAAQEATGTQSRSDTTGNSGASIAEERAKRLLEGEGTDGVLAEISRLRGDSLKWPYYRVLLQQGDLSARKLRQVTGHAAGEIENAGILKGLLVEISARQVDDRELTEALITAADGVEVPRERNSILIAIIKRRRLHPAAGQAIASSLTATSSDPEKLSLMLELASSGPLDEETLSSYIEAIPSLYDSGNRRQAIYALMSRQPLNGELWILLLQEMKSLSSQEGKTALLVEAAQLFPSDNQVVIVYLEVVNTITDSAEKNRALEALILNHSFNDDGLLILIDMSRTMSSDVDRASTLILVTRFSIQDEQVFYEYLNAVKTIDTSFEIERALRALLTSQKLRYEVLQEAKRVTFRLQNEILRREILQLIRELQRNTLQRP